MRRTAWTAVAGSVLALGGGAVVSAATTAPTPAAKSPAQASTLSWGACADESDPDLQCATLTVPLDYAHPESGSVDLALVRLPALKDRKGAILVNPGGPGASGFEFAAGSASGIDQLFGLDRRFDIVGFDPRGVDRSGAIRCVDDATLDAIVYLDDTPDTPEEQAALDDVDDRFGAACRGAYGDTLRFYSTANTARDMDGIRAALGDEQISYLGISYGTYLGGVYARMFPERVRAMVLDSASERTDDSEFDQWATSLIGTEHAFDDWAAWCQAGNGCAFTALDVGARWDALFDRLDSDPITADDGRPANQVVLEIGTRWALYSRSQWSELGQALADAEAGDATRLLALADDYNGRRPDGTYNSLYQSYWAIYCASGLNPYYPSDPEALLAQIKAAAPRWTRTMDLDSFDDFCDGLIPERQKAYTPAYSGTAPILVVGGLNDPATPIRWAEELVAELGPSATLLTNSGEGHGGIGTSACIDDAEAATLRDLTLPPVGTTCAPDPYVPRPAFWDQLPVPAGVGARIDDPDLDGVLGFKPTEAYTDTWALTGDAQTVATEYQQALQDLGMQTGDPQDSDGVLVVPALAADGTPVRVAIFPATLLATADYADLQQYVPAGQGLVVVLALSPQS